MLIGRRLRSDDRDALRARLQESMSHAGESWAGDDGFERFFERVLDPAVDLVFVGAFDDVDLVGVASVARVESSYRFRPFAWCDDVFVAESARGRGVGRCLMDAVHAVASEWQATSILVGVGEKAEAAAFYTRVGFRDMANRLYFCTLPD